jgi:hypothetical protein
VWSKIVGLGSNSRKRQGKSAIYTLRLFCIPFSTRHQPSICIETVSQIQGLVFLPVGLEGRNPIFEL